MLDKKYVLHRNNSEQIYKKRLPFDVWMFDVKIGKDTNERGNEGKKTENADH